MASAELLDLAETLRLPPSPDPWSDRARRYTTALMRDGPLRYADNAWVGARLLRVDDRLMPVIVASGDEGRGVPAAGPPRATPCTVPARSTGPSRGLPGLPVRFLPLGLRLS